MKDRLKVYLALIGLLCLASFACSDDPNAVGLGVLPPQDSLRVISGTVSGASDTTFLSRFTSGSSTLLVGKYQTLEARSLLSFSGLSTISPTSILDSAVLTLRTNYRFKDSSGTLGFEAHSFYSAFNGSKFTWDSTTAPGAYSDTVSGRYLQNITQLDSVITLRLDTTLIRQWMQKSTGALILLPGGNLIVGFSVKNTTTGDLRPMLAITHHDSTDTSRTSTFRSAPSVFVADGAPPPIPGEVILQAGISQRGIFRLDTLSIPPRVSITQAILELTADTAASLLNAYSDDNLFVFLSRKNVFPYDSLALGTKCTPTHNSSGRKVYRADIKAIVQQWLIREPNNGLVFRASSELTTLDRFVLYGASAADTLRPKLTVTYTVLP